MQMTRTSLWSGITRTRDLDITPEQIEAWEGGMVLQDAMPQLSPADREFLISGLTEEEWTAMAASADREERGH
jgi:hypothetical protein